MADALIDLSELRALGNDLETLAGALHNQALLERIGLAGVRAVRARTRQGIDRHGAPFQPYSARYQAMKQDAEVFAGHPQLEYGIARSGLAQAAPATRASRTGSVGGTQYTTAYGRQRPRSERAGGLPADARTYRPNLYDSMLSHLMTIVVGDLETALVAFDRQRDERIAGYHVRGEGHNPQRDFMGLMPTEADALADLVDAHIDRVFSIANLH